MQHLKRSAIRGGLANLAGQAVNAALRIGSIVVFARLLDPSDFGLMAMVTSTFGILSMFKDVGLSTASIQRSEVSNEQLSALFWINMLVGTILTTITLIGAWPVASVYREPRLIALTVVFSTSFVVGAAAIQHASLLKRQMRFSTLATIDTASLLGGIAVGLAMAWSGLGYWALVGMTLGNLTFYAILLWLNSGWIPGRPATAQGVGSMLLTGSLITANGLVMHLAQNLDKMLLGRRFGAESLGLYSRAQQLVSFPTDVVNSAIGGVLLSALSRVKDDPERLKSYFLKSYSLLVSITTPIAVVLGVFADDIVRLLLGPKWVDAVPMFRWLAPTVLVYGTLSPMYSLLVSLNLVGRSLRMSLVLGPVMAIGYIVGMQWGVVGAAIGLSVSMALWSVPHLAWTVHGTPVALREVLVSIGRPLAAALVAAVSAYAAAVLTPAATAPALRLAIALAVFLAAYALLLLVAMRQWALFKDVLLTVLGRTPAVSASAAGS